MTNSVPDRWLEYNAFGDVIKGTKILAFKVPLKDAIARNLQPTQRFTTTALLEAFPHLKYIIDLTNTYRYYDQK
ncbi:Putative tyrosine-protein phosphatase 1 [Trachymyrmex cornetzi]|uniref:Putative tyrosine-protein phosphatase 1 n=2 Tax=Trachymyrmex cornetzi TaxID=471704 RepID=A0A151IY67_9HYME|nr:Putative tyrosine-protein phosphatase 1 [Trachymyrmex cornetzi]